MQLNKFIASCGICSRRNAAELVKTGAITVNSLTILEPGYKVKPIDIVRYKDTILVLNEKVHIILNKPCGYITTVSDEKNRKTVIDLINLPEKNVRLFPVGRLDKETTGILILTNDGDLAQKLAHPKYEKIKIYQATLDKPFTHEHLQLLQKGIILSDGFCKVDNIKIISADNTTIQVTIHSGKNRIVRRLFEHFHYTVKALDRTHYAGITQQNLIVGAWRPLSCKEIALLLAANTKK